MRKQCLILNYNRPKSKKFKQASYAIFKASEYTKAKSNHRFCVKFETTSGQAPFTLKQVGKVNCLEVAVCTVHQWPFW